MRFPSLAAGMLLVLTALAACGGRKGDANDSRPAEPGFTIGTRVTNEMATPAAKMSDTGADDAPATKLPKEPAR